MKMRRFPGLATAFLLVVFLSAIPLVQAQRMAPAVPARATPPAAAGPVARPATVRATSARPAVHATSATRVISTNTFPVLTGDLNTLQELLNTVPGLGFDFEHLAAMNQDLGIKAVIDPETEWRVRVAERLLRGNQFAFGTGAFLLDGGGYYPVPVESGEAPQQPQPPQVIVVQAAPVQSVAPQEAAPPEESAAPLPDIGQFILVLKNGTQIQAVAFTRMNDQIVFITADGTRHTIAVADLDSAATVRINEERGTPLTLPL